MRIRRSAARAIHIKEERAELVKHHLDVLWHDYFKPEHLETVPNLHELFWNANKQVSKVKASTDIADSEEAPRHDRRDRRRLEGDRRSGEDAGRRPTWLTRSSDARSRGPAERRGLVVRRPCATASAVRGGSPIRQASMEPTIDEGDWLLVDPTTARWPRRGSVVAFHEPDSGTLAVKRVAGPPGDRVPFREGYLELADDEAWLIADADDGHDDRRRATALRSIRAGSGRCPVDLLVGRVWFRYGPLRRLGPIARLRRRPDHRGVDGGGPSRVASPGIEPMDPLEP